ncbi:unnamed protein product [Clonostachys rosea]|uniref:BHLH domain-containing protein n=1 Tax=Bionectria ochroleuca TaxID=29856 RepID=A0ABY6U8R0_BIOOC|nr:unnamed protein product [Clonostachys rosea]
MGNTAGPDSSPDDEVGLARKRPRSPDPETAPVHVPKKKQRHSSSITTTKKTTAKPARSSKKRAHSPECYDSLEAGDAIARKRHRPGRDAEQTSHFRRLAAHCFLTPPPPPPQELLQQEHARSVADVQRIRSGLQDIERRLARLAKLCEADKETP